MLPLIPGLDSASPPFKDDIALAYAQGYRWWGFYLNGIDGDEDPLITWLPTAVDSLRIGKIIPVPIWVPNPSLNSDPIEAANEAFLACLGSGLHPTITCLYNGNHIPVTGPVWLPISEPIPSDVGPFSAIQYSAGLMGTTSVDFNVASADFPAKQVLVVDFEFNTAPRPDWYNTFRNEINTLNTPSIPGTLKDGPMMYRDTSTGAVICIDGHFRFIVDNPTDYQAGMQAGVGVWEVSHAQYQIILNS